MFHCVIDKLSMTTRVERGEWDSKPQAMLGESYPDRVFGIRNRLFHLFISGRVDRGIGRKEGRGSRELIKP